MTALNPSAKEDAPEVAPQACPVAVAVCFQLDQKMMVKKALRARLKLVLLMERHIVLYQVEGYAVTAATFEAPRQDSPGSCLFEKALPGILA